MRSNLVVMSAPSLDGVAELRVDGFCELGSGLMGRNVKQAHRGRLWRIGHGLKAQAADGKKQDFVALQPGE